MKAVVLTGTGGYDVLQVQERPDPPVGPGEVRIAVKAAGINFADTMARVGLYPDAPKPPCVLGYEVAGEVESVGDGVSEFAGRRPGRRRHALRRPGRAGHRPRGPGIRRCLPALSFEQGAAIPVNYGTAYAALILMGSLRKGDRVLIHAAAGGVGIAATQIARNAGAEIFGTASPVQARGDPRRRGSITRSTTARRTSRQETMRITGGEGSGPGDRRTRPDLFPQGLPPASLRRPDGHVRALRGNRRTASGDITAMLKSLVSMPNATMPWWKSLLIMNENKGVFGLNMLKWWDAEGSLDRVLDPLTEDLEAGRLEPVVAEAFPFERAGDAHKFIAERRNVGKVVLFPQ